METDNVDREYISRQFFAMLVHIAKGQATLSDWVVVPEDFGRKVRADDALSNASRYLDTSIPDHWLDRVEQACKAIDVRRQSDRMNVIARALFERLRTAATAA